MATDTTISSPRIDRKFVDGQGNLTQNAYALLYTLILRTGGTVAPVIDIPSINGRLDGLEAAPLPQDHSAQIDALFSVLDTMPAQSEPPQPPDLLQDNQSASLAAEIENLRARIEALENAP